MKYDNTLHDNYLYESSKGICKASYQVLQGHSMVLQSLYLLILLQGHVHEHTPPTQTQHAHAYGSFGLAV